MTQSASWIGFQVPLPGKDLLEGVRSALEVLMVFLEIAKAILETIKAFLLDFGNPLIALLEALIALILDLFKALQQTGLFAYYDMPDPFKDPNWKALAGGFQAFKQRWKGSLLDVKDSHRPQPVAGLLTGGFFLFVIDADGPLALIQLVKSILAFFGNPNKFITPQYPPPVHLKAIPLKPGAGDPILNVVDMFSSQVKDIAIEWQLPGSTPTGDVGFAGVTSQIVQAFRVPNWLIEVGYDPPTVPIQITPDPIVGTWDTSVMSNLRTGGRTTGRLVQVTTTGFTDPRNLGNTFTGLAAVTDEYYDPIIKMAFYAVIDGFAAFLSAQLGKVRFVFSNVPLDQDIYIRVRAFFGQLDTAPFTVSGSSSSFVTLNWKSPLVQNQGRGSSAWQLPWPAVDPATQMSMGKPSAMIHTKLSSIPNIDVIGDITAIFECAFSLNFHVPLPPAIPELNAQGQPLLDNRKNPIYFPQFDSAGNPIPPLTVANIGQGSITDIAGGVAGNIFTAPPAAFNASDFQPDPVTHIPPQMPWQTTAVRNQSKRLAIRFANILLESGGPLLQAFKTLLRGPLPAGAVDVSWPGVGNPHYLEQLVLAFTNVTTNPPNTGVNTNPTVVAALTEALPNTTVTLGTATAYGQAFSDASVRRNIVAAVNFLKSLNYQGTPPDWISVSLLDLIPWSGQILYDLIAKIQALVDAFKGVVQEIIDFINMLERKINTLEQFIEYLISILNFLLNLEVGFFVLPVPSIEGDVSAWLATIDNAGGTVPSSGPSGYTAGLCLAYLGPDVSAIAAAFALLF
jgi:hypothetical protein